LLPALASQRLRSAVIDVRSLDITTDKLLSNTFDLVLARMLLLHLPDPAEVDHASALEAEGLRTMTDMMQASGVHLALGPKLPEGALRRRG